MSEYKQNNFNKTLDMIGLGLNTIDDYVERSGCDLSGLSIPELMRVKQDLLDSLNEDLETLGYNQN